MQFHFLRLALLSGLFILSMTAAIVLLVYNPEPPSASIVADEMTDTSITDGKFRSEFGWIGSGQIPENVYSSSDSTIEFLLADFYTRKSSRVIVVESAELYSKPGGGIVTEAVFLEPVNPIAEPKNGFIQVELPIQRGYTGFVRENQITEYEIPPIRGLGIVKELNVRGFRVDTGETDLILPPGAVLPILGSAGDVLQVATPFGTVWVNEKSVKSLKAGVTADEGETLATARLFIGQPYKWGGVSFSHVDCSGFVHLVYRMNGVLLKRDADIQFADDSAEKVAADSMDACDLLYIATYKTTASHVGILTGEGAIIHASPQKGVVEEPLSNSTFSRHSILGVRSFNGG